jgi:hypothetical protein
MDQKPAVLVEHLNGGSDLIRMVNFHVRITVRCREGLAATGAIGIRVHIQPTSCEKICGLNGPISIRVMLHLWEMWRYHKI